MRPELGIIEGYFGRCWTWAERASVVDRLAPAGYGYFHYAPKIETKLRRDWRTAHSTSEAASIASFADHCHARGMRFGIGLTPYGAQLEFCDDARAAMKAKVAQLDSLGIDDLAILFDDMRGDIPDLAERQAAITDFIISNSRASRFFVCPTYYSNDPKLDRVFGVRPGGYLEGLGRKLDPAVAVYWTGEEVCSPEISLAHVQEIAGELGRRVALWDNYPVNDGPRMSQYIHLRAFTGRSADLGQQITHHAINPASQPILGCIPALTLPMSYQQGPAYQYSAAFRSAAATVCGDELATLLYEDLLTFQAAGLDRLSDAAKADLRVRYGAFDHPIVSEILDWLDGDFAITGEMLRTQ